MAQRHVLDRDKLYEEVWAEPMTKVSKRYGISGVTVAKVCRKMAIPVSATNSRDTRMPENENRESHSFPLTFH
jgi:hypothetical protein